MRLIHDNTEEISLFKCESCGKTQKNVKKHITHLKSHSREKSKSFVQTKHFRNFLLEKEKSLNCSTIEEAAESSIKDIVQELMYYK